MVSRWLHVRSRWTRFLCSGPTILDTSVLLADVSWETRKHSHAGAIKRKPERRTRALRPSSASSPSPQKSLKSQSRRRLPPSEVSPFVFRGAIIIIKMISNVVIGVLKFSKSADRTSPRVGGRAVKSLGKRWQ